MARWLAAAAVCWPVVLGAAWHDHRDHRPGVASVITYVVASRVCHQRPDRSFATGGQQWPVCARCSGLYLAAPAGAWLALGLSRRRASGFPLLVPIAALPTAVSMLVEWATPSSVSSLARCLAALPLGAWVAFAIVRVAAEGWRDDQVN